MVTPKVLGQLYHKNIMIAFFNTYDFVVDRCSNCGVIFDISIDNWYSISLVVEILVTWN